MGGRPVTVLLISLSHTVSRPKTLNESAASGYQQLLGKWCHSAARGLKQPCPDHPTNLYPFTSSTLALTLVYNSCTSLLVSQSKCITVSFDVKAGRWLVGWGFGEGGRGDVTRDNMNCTDSPAYKSGSGLAHGSDLELKMD